MPLVAAAVLCYAAGLLAGFGHAMFAIPASGLVVALGAQRDVERFALSVLIGAGFAAAAGAERRDAQCAARELRVPNRTGQLEADASPGAFVTARDLCGTRLFVAVRAGRAAAGATVTILGEATRSRGGLLIAGAEIRQSGAPALLSAWRAAIGRRVDAHFGGDAPLVRALLIADMRDLSPAVRDRFASAGLSHMLSVSGLHVGLIAVAVSLVGQLAGLPRRRSDAAVLALTTLYVAVIGAPLPAVRSAVMLGVASLSHMLQRPTSAWAVLALGAGLPLVDPSAILDLGYQLSVVGMVALVAAGALSKRWEWLRVGGWQGTLRRSIATSAVATALTAPLVAATFGRISLVAPVSNLVAVPVMGVLQPMLFLAVVLMPVPAAAQFIADASHPLAASIDRLAGAFAAIPGASVGVAMDDVSIVLACAAATAFVVAASSRFPGRALIAAVGALAVLVWRPLVGVGVGSGFTELHMIDVGQGDAVALRTARGRWMLFDAGRDWMGGDEGRRDVIPYLRARGGALVAFSLSHPHSDHAGGAASAIRALRPGVYFDPAYAGTTPSYRASLVAARDVSARWRRVHPGDSLVIDEVVVTFLAPDSSWAESQRDPNSASAVARIRAGEIVMLLTGDAETPEEEWLVARDSGALRADVLKVAHHGSRTSTSAAFLERVAPRLALVSVGAGNMYGHPNASVLAALADAGATTLRTDLHGTIVVRTDGHRLEVVRDGVALDVAVRCEVSHFGCRGRKHLPQP